MFAARPLNVARMSSSSSAPAAHPLTQRLLELVRERPLAGPVIEVGTGSGRNTRALVEAGVPLVSVPDDVLYTQLPGGRETYGAALSSHAYLHGTSAKLRAGFGELRRVLVPEAPIFVTLGSFRDARYGLGLPLDERSFAPGEGGEAGIPHAYSTATGSRRCCAACFGSTGPRRSRSTRSSAAGPTPRTTTSPAGSTGSSRRRESDRRGYEGRMHVLRVAVATVLAAGLASAALAQGGNLIRNGDFEAGGPVPSWLSVHAGSGAVSGWRVTSGYVDLVGRWWQPAGGVDSLEVGSPGPGAVEQTIATVPGAAIA